MAFISGSFPLFWARPKENVSIPTAGDAASCLTPMSLAFSPKMPVQLTTALRVVGTSLFALAVLGGILAAYVTGYQFIHTEKHYLSFGLYGAILGLHLLTQSLFAFLEHRHMRRAGRPLKLPSPPQRSVALCIAAYQEDPDYLRKCLRSAQRIAFPNLKVVMVVDGNRQEDAYMLDIFHEVLGGTEQAGFFVWRSNFHETGEGETEASLQEGMGRVRDVVRASTFSCIMQKWGGKREVMYTAFKALGDSVDYIQVRVSPYKCVDVSSQLGIPSSRSFQSRVGPLYCAHLSSALKAIGMMVLNSSPGVIKTWDRILVLLLLSSVTCVLKVIIANRYIAFTSYQALL